MLRCGFMADPATPKKSTASELAAKLGLYTASMIVIGSMVGSGIFKKPALMATQLGSPKLMVLVWLVAGLITCFGALANAEVASMITAVGGQYVFFRRIYNDFAGFLYGWAIFAVIQTGSIASISYVCAEYIGYFVQLPHLSPELEHYKISLLGIITIQPLADIGTKVVTATCVLFLSGLNVIGVAVGGAVQNVFTTFKMVAILGVVLACFTLGGQPAAESAATVASGAAPVIAHPSGIGLIGAMVAALSGAFWAYDGWNNITYIAGEVRQPSRNIPRALFLGTAAVALLYILVNLAYVHVLPLEKMAGSTLVAADAMRSVLGRTGGALISALVILSTFGTANGTILASARVHFAMARDGLFFRSLGQVIPRFQTPARSLLWQGLWSAALVFSGTFDQLTDMLIFVSWIFYLAGALGVFVLRVREPDTPRPYKVWGYPVVPAVFVLFAATYVVITLRQDFRNSVFGLLLVGLGVPLYLYWRRRGARVAG
jgi:basic amino acid/polyamine antiporter, APA family